jgi:prepilin-type N-terminal cleavage/methylation domain-containing protein
MKYRTDREGFTLVELLTVIGIIAVLAGILIPTVNVALRKAKISKARQEAEAIALALKSYHDEYGRWPDVRPGSSGRTLNDWPSQRGYDRFNDTNWARTVNAAFISALTGINTKENPKRIEFLVVKDENRVEFQLNAEGLDPDEDTYYFADPWDYPYFIACDVDYDRETGPPYHNKTGVDVYSVGPVSDPRIVEQHREEEAGTYDGAINNW